MKKKLGLVVLLMVVFVVGLKASEKLQFRILKHGNYGEAIVQDNKESGFTMSLQNTAKKNHAIALASLKQDANVEESVNFSMCGAKTNGKAFMSVLLLYQNGKNWKTVGSYTLGVNNDKFKSYKLGLKRAFKLKDKVYQLRQIKFILNADLNAKGSKANIEVKNVSICK